MNLLKLAGAFAIVLALSGCANTIRGVGTDVRQSADAVADSLD